jgi:hypothetical protein
MCIAKWRLFNPSPSNTRALKPPRREEAIPNLKRTHFVRVNPKPWTIKGALRACGRSRARLRAIRRARRRMTTLPLPPTNTGRGEHPWPLSPKPSAPGTPNPTHAQVFRGHLNPKLPTPDPNPKTLPPTASRPLEAIAEQKPLNQVDAVSVEASTSNLLLRRNGRVVARKDASEDKVLRL